MVFISEFLNIYKVVPQGSVLGPLLFSIYSNDFNCGVTNSLIHLYADDSYIVLLHLLNKLYIIFKMISALSKELDNEFRFGCKSWKIKV